MNEAELRAAVAPLGEAMAAAFRAGLTDPGTIAPDVDRIPWRAMDLYGDVDGIGPLPARQLAHVLAALAWTTGRAYRQGLREAAAV